jgi:hypothetical protein
MCKDCPDISTRAGSGSKIFWPGRSTVNCLPLRRTVRRGSAIPWLFVTEQKMIPRYRAVMMMALWGVNTRFFATLALRASI